MRISIILFLVFLSVAVDAQQYMDTNDPREIKSLLSKDNQLDGFGGADLRITDLKSQRTILMGGYGGVLINRNYMLGVAAYGLLSSPSFDGVLPDQTIKELNLYGGYAGVLIGGTLFTKELIHLSLPVMFGAGQLQVSDQSFFTSSSDTEFTIEQSAFFVIEPSALLEFNLTRTFRLGVGASYRWTEGLDLTNVADDELMGWSGSISLKFGRF
ncbi:MAG: hypothetical protein ACI8QD_001681 [Cyclobacteriaceae bacterium]|jgi:hypothetical protein